MREGTGKRRMLREVAGAGATSAGAGGSAQAELTFEEVQRMAEEVVRRSPGGVLGSAFKKAFYDLYHLELQLSFRGQPVQLKDILETSTVVERFVVNTQPLYR